MAERTSRTARREGGSSAVVTDRVIEALVALRALGCARTTDLMRVTGHPSRNAFNKWMRKCVDAGLVRVYAADLAEENCYALSRDGWAEVVKALPEIQNAQTPVVREATAHRLLISAFWCMVAAAVRRQNGSLRAWPEEALRSAAKNGLVPDLLLAVTGGAATMALLVEADAATEGATFLHDKVERFESARGSGALFGFPAWRVVWVVNDTARARFLLRTIGEKAREVEHLVINFENVDASTVFEHSFDVARCPDSQATLTGNVRGKA